MTGHIQAEDLVGSAPMRFSAEAVLGLVEIAIQAAESLASINQFHSNASLKLFLRKIHLLVNLIPVSIFSTQYA